MYSAGKTSLLWRYNPSKTHIAAEDIAPAHMKDLREFLTVVACMPGINTYQLLQQASQNLRAFNEMKIPTPKHHKANNRTCIMTTTFLDPLKELFCTRGSGQFLGTQTSQLLQHGVTAGQLACTSAAESYWKIFFPICLLCRHATHVLGHSVCLQV